MALATDPTLLILDEPTTGARRNGRGRGARPGRGAAHASSTRRPVHQPQPRRDREDVRPRRRAVRRRLVEEGPAREVFDDPRHPYTVGLLRCMPRRGSARTTAGSTRSRASCRRRAQICRAASSPTAARLAADRCRTEPPPPYDVGERHGAALPLPRARRRRCRGGAGRAASAAEAREDGPICAASERREDVQAGRPRDPRRWSASTSTCGPARRSGWWASPAAARPRSRECSLGLIDARRGATIELDGKRWPARGPARGREAQSKRCRSSSRIPTRRSTAATRCGRILRRVAAAARRLSRARQRDAAAGEADQIGAAGASATSTCGRRSCPAGSSSGSRSRGRSRATRGWWSATSRPRRSTCRCRRRS